MEHSNFLKITLEDGSLGNIYDFCKEAIEIRDKTGLPVEFKFNKLLVVVNEGSTVNSLCAQFARDHDARRVEAGYETQISADGKYYIR